MTTRMDPARDCTIVDSTPIDYSISPPRHRSGLKIGMDATHKWEGETDGSGAARSRWTVRQEPVTTTCGFFGYRVARSLGWAQRPEARRCCACLKPAELIAARTMLPLPTWRPDHPACSVATSPNPRHARRWVAECRPLPQRASQSTITLSLGKRCKRSQTMSRRLFFTPPFDGFLEFNRQAIGQLRDSIKAGQFTATL